MPTRNTLFPIQNNHPGIAPTELLLELLVFTVAAPGNPVQELGAASGNPVQELGAAPGNSVQELGAKAIAPLNAIGDSVRSPSGLWFIKKQQIM